MVNTKYSFNISKWWKPWIIILEIFLGRLTYYVSSFRMFQADSDIVLGYVSEDGQALVSDR